MKSNYIEDFIKIKSNKYSKEETERMFLGLLFYMLNDREIFKLNLDVKDFIITVFEYDYKEYLYRSRPMLASRLMNDIRKNKTYGDILMLDASITKYLQNNFVIKNENSKAKTKSNNNTNLTGWLNMTSEKIDGDN
ncbi:hypothetical protein [Mammaliicoccus sciuri]|uniref:hypothetical protein n=1 Tax=Mammaliicoccus sciuri TaxID=1296 RepID=UPI00195319D2|nr:hypothetical protein [Mammaliicoccus sciuri]